MNIIDNEMQRIETDANLRSLFYQNKSGLELQVARNNIREALRKMHYQKRAIMEPYFDGLYNKDASDEEIYNAAQQRKNANDSLLIDPQGSMLDPRRFEVKYKKLGMWREIFPIHAFQPGLQSVRYNIEDQVGEAAIVGRKNTTVPVINPTLKQETHDIVALAAGYTLYSQEIRQASAAGIPFEDRHVRSVERAYATTLDKLFFLGNNEGTRVEGAFNHTGVPNDAATKTFAASTVEEILSTILGMSTKIRVDSKGNFGFEGLILLLPQTQYDLIATTRLGSVNDTTIMKYILDNKQFGISEIKAVFDLKGLGTGGTDLAFIFQKDPDVIEAWVADQILWRPMQPDGLAVRFVSEMETGGIVIRYPFACGQLYGI